MAKLRVEIVTPTGSVLDTEANAVRIPGATGEAGILPDHRPALIMLSGGVIQFEGSDAEAIAIRGGVAEVRPDGVLILADEAAPLKSIDKQVAIDGMKALDETLATATLNAELLMRADADRRYFGAILGG